MKIHSGAHVSLRKHILKPKPQETTSHPTKMGQITARTSYDLENWESLFTAVENVKWWRHLGKQLGRSTKS